MAEEEKPQLTEEERIARKARLFRIISNILIVVAVIVLAVFLFFAWGTKKNINTQTALDTQELRSKLKQVISLEKRYYQDHGEYVKINYMQLSKELPVFNPDPSGNFKYKFEPETGIATGVEKDASHDANGDVDGTDGLTLSVNWEPGVVDGNAGGNFFWTDEDKVDLQKRAAEEKK